MGFPDQQKSWSVPLILQVLSRRMPCVIHSQCVRNYELDPGNFHRWRKLVGYSTFVSPRRQHNPTLFRCQGKVRIGSASSSPQLTGRYSQPVYKLLTPRETPYIRWTTNHINSLSVAGFEPTNCRLCSNCLITMPPYFPSKI